MMKKKKNIRLLFICLIPFIAVVTRMMCTSYEGIFFYRRIATASVQIDCYGASGSHLVEKYKMAQHTLFSRIVGTLQAVIAVDLTIRFLITVILFIGYFI
ncbi:MAG: hypothetical protein IPQ18_14630 [Saprospiraceae bacterium]|nr:hypothetical protein [Saprospiraceae bacterium]